MNVNAKKINNEASCNDDIYSGVGFFRVKDIIKIIPVSIATWWAWVKSGKAPAAIKLSEKITVWSRSEIYAFAKQLEEEGIVKRQAAVEKIRGSALRLVKNEWGVK